MKKIFKVSLFALLFALMMPFTMFLSGCGATPTKEVLGVFFVPKEYDEETGLALFEVDLNVKTKLDYKVNPSTWAGYAVTYAVKECTPNNRSRFTLDDGIINVEKKEFEEIKIEIMINGYLDTCIVRLKQYPTKMFLVNNAGVGESREVSELNVVINASGSYTINPVGRFVDAAGTVTEKSLMEEEYDFTVKSSDVTIIDVPNEKRLKVCSVRDNVGSAKITVNLNDATGKVLHTVIVNITVVLNAHDAVAVLDGYNKFVRNQSSIEISASDLDKDADGNAILGYQLFAKSKDGRYINAEVVEIDCTVSNVKYATADSDNARVLIETPEAGIEEISFNVSLWTNLIMDNAENSAYSITFTVKVLF